MIRVGHGIDYHVFDDLKSSLMLGGLEFFPGYGVKAHSDGDIILHSIVSAFLGALGKCDIGHHFPDIDNRYKDKESTFFLSKALEMILDESYVIYNLDITIICDRLKISPIRESIRDNIIKLVKSDNVNLKATTKERMDDIGRGFGIGCHVICLLVKDDLHEKFFNDNNT
ncbi:2-C-methyl-D-erythritol 2,4-cyclodiphosphate synthase [Anaplasmataceae bacterium AB001_6]|nr:2-C-methyl-D-erythritol 2,4-cyclodiphosphate synthase [Anaplasmataceae bacterium AB001_6]